MTIHYLLLPPYRASDRSYSSVEYLVFGTDERLDLLTATGVDLVGGAEGGAPGGLTSGYGPGTELSTEGPIVTSGGVTSEPGSLAPVCTSLSLLPLPQK